MLDFAFDGARARGNSNRGWFPRTAVYTIRTNGSDTFKRWPSKETALAFLVQSVYASQRHFPKVVLYTDSYGQYLFRDIPFDEVVVSLDNFDISPFIRSACKLHTYSRQKAPFVHLDWDFILWQKREDRLKSPLVAQSKSTIDGLSRIALIIHSLGWKPRFIQKLLNTRATVDLPCPSVLGGMNYGFLRWYSALSLRILRHPLNAHIQVLAEGELADDISIAIEQWLLGACAKHRGIDISYLAEEPTSHVNSVDTRNLPRLGFVHLGGNAKHSKYWIDKIKERNEKLGLTLNQSSRSGFFGAGGDKDPEVVDLKAVPYKVLISLEKHYDRREKAIDQFSRLALDVEWKIPVKLDSITWSPTNYRYKSRPASASHAATILEILDEVEKRKSESFLMFEDDVVFHPEIEALLSEIRVPRDWKFIYLGGRNCGVKREISKGLVRSNFIADLHGVIVRSDMINPIRLALMDPCIDSIWLDFRIATLHDRYPAYLFRPNLAWQSAHDDGSGQGEQYCNYLHDGTVKSGQGD